MYGNKINKYNIIIFLKSSFLEIDFEIYTKLALRSHDVSIDLSEVIFSLSKVFYISINMLKQVKNDLKVANTRM